MKKPVMLKIFTAVALVVCFVMTSRAQDNSTMRFDYDSWDFGMINEEDGTVSHTFRFTNTGERPIVIEHISVSCGCTSPSFTREPVMPGKRGEIRITYDPANRAGMFSQSVRIQSDGGKNNNTLVVKGNVLPRERTVSELYQFPGPGGLVFNTTSVNFRYVEQGVPVSMTVGYANPTDKKITFSYQYQPQFGHLKVSAPKEICAGCKGEITLTYDVSGGNYGRFVERIFPVVNGQKAQVPISVTAIAVDKIKGVDVQKAAKAVISPVYRDMGKVKAGSEQQATYRVTNNGKQPMVVRWIGLKSNMKCTLKKGDVIQPGRNAEFTLTIKIPEDASGHYSSTFSVIVNDPSRPMRELRVMATVV